MNVRITHFVSLSVLLLASTAVAEEAKACSANARDCEQAIRQMMAGYRYLGAQVQELNPGLMVKDVSPDGPADRGDLRPGDRLMAVNGHSTTAGNIRDFKKILSDAKDDGRLWIIVQRNGTLKKVNVHLEPYSKQQVDKIVAQHLATSHAIAAAPHQ